MKHLEELENERVHPVLLAIQEHLLISSGGQAMRLLYSTMLNAYAMHHSSSALGHDEAEMETICKDKTMRLQYCI